MDGELTASRAGKDEMGPDGGSHKPEADLETGIQVQAIYLGSRTP